MAVTFFFQFPLKNTAMFGFTCWISGPLKTSLKGQGLPDSSCWLKTDRGRSMSMGTWNQPSNFVAPYFETKPHWGCHLAATCSTKTAGTSDFASAASAIPIHCPWSSSNGFEIQVWEITLSPLQALAATMFFTFHRFSMRFSLHFSHFLSFSCAAFPSQKNTSTLGTTNPSPNRHHQICIPPLPSQSPKPSPSILFVTQPST